MKKLPIVFMLFVLSDTSCLADSVINNPQVGGYGLDYCREWTQNCGWPAAHAFCQSQGYQKAVDFKWAKDNQKTRIINGGQVCDAPFCDRISQVICKESTEEGGSAGQTFNNPTVDGRALDICREWAANCGKPAADAYCEKNGYGKAITYRFRNDSPPTTVINGGQVCNQPTCDRITSVTCGYQPFD